MKLSFFSCWPRVSPVVSVSLSGWLLWPQQQRLSWLHRILSGYALPNPAGHRNVRSEFMVYRCTKILTYFVFPDVCGFYVPFLGRVWVYQQQEEAKEKRIQKFWDHCHQTMQGIYMTRKSTTTTKVMLTFDLRKKLKEKELNHLKLLLQIKIFLGLLIFFV